jgi:uncharacterized protein (TIGR03083 family)
VRPPAPQPPGPVETADLFPALHEALMALLAGLTPEDWLRPTACSGWSVHDVARHLLGGQLGNLSRRRDGFSRLAPAPGEGVAPFVNRINDEWMRAGRRISPAVLRDLMAVTGPQVAAYFASLDPIAIGGAVSWAGPEPAPVWLDVAREYTEWWHHQQHIRDAVGRPGLTEPRYLGPAIATFVHALPAALGGLDAPESAAVSLCVMPAEAGGWWTVRREDGRWRLYAGGPGLRQATVWLDADAAWRLFTRGLDPDAARASAKLEGDPRLAEAVLHTVAIM